MKITVEEALETLINTDEDIATCKEELERAEWMAKRTEALIFDRLDGPMAARAAAARSSEEVNAAQERYLAALLAYERVANKRKTMDIVVGFWRTMEASRRAGA